MKKSFSSGLDAIVLYLLSIALALGTINPFSTDFSVEGESELVLMPILAVAFSIVVLLGYGLNGLKGIPKSVIVSAILFFVGCMFGDVLYDLYSTDYRFLAKLFSVLLFFFSCIVYFSNNPEKIKESLTIYSISCVAILLIVFSFGNESILQINKGRLTIYGENANSTSSRMLFAALFFMYDIIHNKRRVIWRVLEFFAFLLLTLYIVQSGSRGSFISLVLGIVVMMSFLRMKMGRKIIIITMGAAIVLMVFPILKQDENISIFDRFEELESGNVRSELMANAFDIYEDYPFFGVGANGYQKEKERRGYSPLDSHCIVTSIMAIGGTFALLSFMGLWSMLFHTTFKNRKGNILPLIINLCITFIALKTGGVITFVFMWYCYAISYSMATTTVKKT